MAGFSHWFHLDPIVVYGEIKARWSQPVWLFFSPSKQQEEKEQKVVTEAKEREETDRIVMRVLRRSRSGLLNRHFYCTSCSSLF